MINAILEEFTQLGRFQILGGFRSFQELSESRIILDSWFSKNLSWFRTDNIAVQFWAIPLFLSLLFILGSRSDPESRVVR